MELWIRSQDKMNLVKITQINVGYMNNKEIIANYKVLDSETDFYQILGTYKSKERALEVLDEIQNILKPQVILTELGKPIAETCDGTVYREPDKYDIKELSTYVYEMPQE